MRGGGAGKENKELCVDVNCGLCCLFVKSSMWRSIGGMVSGGHRAGAY